MDLPQAAITLPEATVYVLTHPTRWTEPDGVAIEVLAMPQGWDTLVGSAGSIDRVAIATTEGGA